MTGVGGLPAEAYAAALVDLPGMGPARLVALLRQGPPEVLWQRILRGDIHRGDRSPGLPGTGSHAPWAEVAARRDVGRRWSAIAEAAIRVVYYGGPGFPGPLIADPDPPGVLFCLGDLDVIARPRVAIIGTRHCTSYGRSVAVELGHDLARLGVCVISGLALGIDGAAHQGALHGSGNAGPLGVAASGVDTPYPRRHTELWRRVGESGAIISEAAPGQPAQSWRFPARNRIIAALAQAVVVVESHAAGGSMLTVAAAADRGIDVLAVPGPVTSASSAGTNQLLHEGVAPVRDAGDVLAALGDLRPWPPPARPGPSDGQPKAKRQRGPAHVQPSPPIAEALRPTSASWGRPVHLEPPERRVLNSVDRTPTSTGVIADRTGLPIGALSVVLLHLEGLGLVRGEGTWWERRGDE